uniref:Uncharacterized protein n=1 Tax=Solanum tuberosum TaxID=4113 RepID=M1A3F1_SOLTU
MKVDSINKPKESAHDLAVKVGTGPALHSATILYQNTCYRLGKPRINLELTNSRWMSCSLTGEIY